MLVREVMSHNVHCCTASQSASDAAHLMETYDIGCVPVVDERRSPVAIVTDRDLLIAIYRSGRGPRDLPVELAMSKGVFTCRADDTLHAAERIMRDWQLRRLPVVDDAGVICGLLSLNDIALRTEAHPLRMRGELEKTMAAVCRHREPPIGMQA